MPARKLQSVGKVILRPVKLVTQFAHLSSADIPYLHFPPAISHVCAYILACIQDKMTFRVIICCDFFSIVRISNKILFVPSFYFYQNSGH